MIIQILSDLKEEGYLHKGRHPTVAPFFPCANVAFRRAALQEIGGFDTQCVTGEDCDICARLSAAGWELYTRRDAIVSHKNPSNWRHLFRKWYSYGRYHPYVFAKHNERAVEIYGRLWRPVDGERYICLFYRRAPLGVVLFLTRFLMLHLALLGTGAAWLLGWAPIAWVGLGLTAVLAVSYAWPDLRRWGLLLGAAFTGIRYVADLALFVSAFIGGLHQKMLYLSATVD
jgi:cellulose synthase/poly-beta-1,6-N-acetylglucosamine synthase-like glycosyltransferase